MLQGLLPLAGTSSVGATKEIVLLSGLMYLIVMSSTFRLSFLFLRDFFTKALVRSSNETRKAGLQASRFSRECGFQDNREGSCFDIKSIDSEANVLAHRNDSGNVRNCRFCFNSVRLRRFKTESASHWRVQSRRAITAGQDDWIVLSFRAYLVRNGFLGEDRG